MNQQQSKRIRKTAQAQALELWNFYQRQKPKRWQIFKWKKWKALERFYTTDATVPSIVRKFKHCADRQFFKIS